MKNKMIALGIAILAVFCIWYFKLKPATIKNDNGKSYGIFEKGEDFGCVFSYDVTQKKLDSLTQILNKRHIYPTYSKVSFDDTGHLTSINVSATSWGGGSAFRDKFQKNIGGVSIHCKKQKDTLYSIGFICDGKQSLIEALNE